MTLLSLQAVNKVFSTKTVATTALDSVDLTLEAGDYVAICGPSGSGKSTLLNILGLLDSPTSGSYTIDGKDMSKLPASSVTLQRSKYFGFVFQNFNLIPYMTIEENVALALQQNALTKREVHAAVSNVLDRLGVLHRRHHWPSQLSGGQQQRVAIARAIVNRPLVILADEPTGNLDTEHGQSVMQLLEELNADGTSIVMVTHSAEHAARARRRVDFLDGRVVEAAASELMVNQ